MVIHQKSFIDNRYLIWRILLLGGIYAGLGSLWLWKKEQTVVENIFRIRGIGMEKKYENKIVAEHLTKAEKNI